MLSMAPIWPRSPARPSSPRALLLHMLAARVLKNYNHKRPPAKLGPNTIDHGQIGEST